VELGKRLRLFRGKAQNKRIKNSELTSQDSLKDEVDYVLTTATLLREINLPSEQTKKNDGNHVHRDKNKKITHQVRSVTKLPLSENAKMLLVPRPR
jgi:hypothetical protein